MLPYLSRAPEGEKSLQRNLLLVTRKDLDRLKGDVSGREKCYGTSGSADDSIRMTSIVPGELQMMSYAE
jgi:hypothetical protein